MEVSALEQFLVGEVFTFLMIFVRIGTGAMVMPGLGEGYVLSRARLLFAVMMSLMLTPLLSPYFPPVPGSPTLLTLLILSEVLYGLYIGLMARILISAMHIAGTIISFQSGLALATIFDINAGGQSTIIGNFLSLTAVVVLMGMGVHHIVLQGLVDSYSLFPPGSPPPVDDMANYMAELFSNTFRIAVQISAAHMILAMVTYLGAGILSRLMPAFQVFFVLLPAQIYISVLLLMGILTAIMLYYSQYVGNALGGFLTP